MTHQDVTERDQTRESVHSAPRSDADPGDRAGEETSPSGRAGARDSSAPRVPGQPESAQSSAPRAPDSAVTDSDEPGGDEPGGDGDQSNSGARRTGLWDRARQVLAPPDIWSQDRPALRKVWAYAVAGEWTTATGLARWSGQGYAYACIGTTAVLYGLAWVIERPARLAAAMVLVVLLAQFPPLSWLI